MAYSHRCTLKQENKPFKSKHATKGESKRIGKGKVSRNPVKQSKGLTKDQKRDQLKYIQSRKRMEIIENQRLFNGSSACPKHTVVVPLCSDVNALDCVRNVFKSFEQEIEYQNGSCVLNAARFHQRVKLIPVERDLLMALDALKVADNVIFLLSAVEEVDSFGEMLMSCIKTQGVPDVLCMVQHLNDVPEKNQKDVKKSLDYYISHHFAQDVKIFSDDVTGDCINCIRTITNQTPNGISWRDRRPYLVGESIEFTANTGDIDKGKLFVTGYVRGNNLSANRLVYLPDYGDFQVGSIYDASMKNSIADPVLLHSPDPDLRESLVDHNSVDPMEGEQTWPTEDEIKEAEARVRNNEHEMDEIPFEARKKRVPKGTSAYQAAWILEDDEEGEELESGEDQAMSHNSYSPDDTEQEYEEIDEESRAGQFDDLPDKENAEQLQSYLEREREARDAAEFPDEIDTPMHIPASQRFSKYRGLKSFKNSPWDPYENLPVDYSKIFQIENFKRTKKKVFESVGAEGISPGKRVTIEILDVPSAILERDPNRLFYLFGLFQYEHKISVMNFSIQKTDSNTDIVKSKDRMILMAGFRRFIVNPIFSAHSRGGPNNVHKFERFLPEKRLCIGTVYCPIQFGSEPIMLFKYEDGKDWSKNNLHAFVGRGSLIDPQPLRIIAKRVILTGHPYKIHKRGAVVRFMFFNPRDIEYFKPVQLHTKLGRVGHIKESLGTHGYMKCQFDGPLKAHDTICMALYKRVFPVWNTDLSRPGTDDIMK